MIVSACSPVLKAMMLSEMVEMTKHQATLDNIPPAVMELLLEYMYRGEVHIPNEYLMPAIEACDYLELLELKARCVNQTPNAISPNNVISWHKLADSLNIDELKIKCSEILADSFAGVSKDKEFLEMSFTEVSSCISDAQEADADSDDLFEATTNWVAYKSYTRQNHILDMLEKIDLTRCSTECIETEMHKHKDLLYAQPAALGKLTLSLIQIANGPPHNIRKKRSKHGGKMVVVISGQERDDKPQSDCWHLDKFTSFLDFLKLSFSFPWHSVCSIPGGFVVTGGKNNTRCAMFILSSKSWKQLQSLPHSRYCHASIFACGKIYIFGGYRSGMGILSSDVLSLELEGGKWNQEPNVPITRVHLPEVACVGSSIFLLSVYDTYQLLHLDLNTNAWSTKAAPPQQYPIGPRMISVQDRLLVAGGSDMIFAQYDPTTDTWTTGNPPAIQHFLGALVHLDQKVYLIGGDEEDRVEEYDLNTKSWSVCNFRLPQKFQNLHAVVM